MVKEHTRVASTEGCDIESIIFLDEVKYWHANNEEEEEVNQHGKRIYRRG